MSGYIEKIKNAYKLNPAAMQAKITKWIAICGVILGLMVGSFFFGMKVKDNSWQAKIETQKTQIADKRADNAVDAGKRFGVYTRTQAELDNAVAAAQAAIHEYYKNNPTTKQVIVHKDKLVSVPGKQEYVYVPIDSCPNTFFNADELLLWNQGAQGYGADVNDTK